MADQVTLDAMIQRADFAVDVSNTPVTEQIQTLSVESLSKSSLITPMLRKPDFQRETNHWTPAQLITFLESFLDNELIPSIILWRSPAYVFVIDGGHRLSALRAWIEDDYGDGSLSRAFYNNEISSHQKRSAQKTRKLVQDRIGSYARIKDALINQSVYSEKEVARARNMATRSLSLQWVVGDAEKAETSFFKINTQGTPLDKIEELILRNRKRPVAIAARAVLRASTGHKYWSGFSPAHSAKIESLSADIHNLMFKPEITEPIKTLSLPIAGRTSPLNALELLIRFIMLASATQAKPNPSIDDFPEDEDGSGTIGVLEDTLRVIRRITGNEAGSLGLHPAVYFYTENGRHSADMFLGIVRLFSIKMANNDTSFFKKFTAAREPVETFLVATKPVIGMILQAVGSRQRVERISEFFDAMVKKVTSKEILTPEWALDVIAPNNRTRLLIGTEDPSGTAFGRETKSAIYLRDTLGTAPKCPICTGFLEATSSVSYDHDQRVQDGGKGTVDNGRLTHPFCNTAIKN